MPEKRFEVSDVDHSLRIRVQTKERQDIYEFDWKKCIEAANCHIVTDSSLDARDWEFYEVQYLSYYEVTVVYHPKFPH